jgi:putative membrane protein
MKSNVMRASLLGTFLILGSAAALAQDPNMPSLPGTGPGNPPNAQSPGVKNQNGSVYAQDSSANTSGGPDAALMRDKMFLHEVAEGGVAELQLGQLAVQKASNEDVKKFGQAMVDDHATLTDLMKPIASELGVKVPSKMDKGDQAEYDKLKALSGTDFDKEFLLFVVMEHRKNLREFHDEIVATGDPDLREAALNSGKIVLAHAKTASALAKANGVVLPPMQHPQPAKP